MGGTLAPEENEKLQTETLAEKYNEYLQEKKKNENKIAHLEDDIKSKDILLDNNNEQTQKLIEEHNSEISKYKKQINNKNDLLKEKNELYDALRRKWEEIDNENKHIGKERDALEKELYAQRTLTQNLRTENNDLSIRLKHEKNDNEEFNNKINESQLKIDALQETIKQLKKVTQQLKKENDTIKDKINESQLKIDELQETNDVWQDKINELEDTNRELNDDIQNTDDTIVNDIIKLKSELKKMNLNYDEKLEECHRLKVDKRMLGNTINTKDSYIKEMQNRNKSTLLGLQAKQANIRQENIKLKEENKLLIGTKDMMKNNEKQLEMKLETLNNEMKDLRNENEKLQNIQKKYNDLQTQNRERVMELQGDIKNYKNKMKDKNNEINGLKEKLLNEKQDSGIEYDAKIKGLKEENVRLVDKIKSIQNGYEQMKKEKKQLIIEHDTYVLQLNEINELKENKMSLKMNKLDARIEELMGNNQEAEEVKNKNETEINSLRDKLEDIRRKYNEIQIKNNELSENISDNSEKHKDEIKRLESDLDVLKKENEKKQNQFQRDLADAQKTIINMTSIVEVKQKLPTINEAIIRYQTLKDQYYAETSNLLKKYFKEHDQYKDYHKHYRGQTIHKILFESLLGCFLSVKLYKKNMLNDIAEKLNMKNMISNMSNENIDDVKENTDDDKMRIIRSKLMNIFGSFFKNNYEYILKSEDISNEVLNKILTEKFENIKFKTKQIESLKKYIVKCCEVFWILILQDPPLNITPMVWNVVDEKIKFNEDIHKRVLGSDKKCDTVAYYVWPSLQKENENEDANEYLQELKLEVVLRDSLYDEKLKK